MRLHSREGSPPRYLSQQCFSHLFRHGIIGTFFGIVRYLGRQTGFPLAARRWVSPEELHFTEQQWNLKGVPDGEFDPHRFWKGVMLSSAIVVGRHKPFVTAMGCSWLGVRLVYRLIWVRVPLARRSWAVIVLSRSVQISRLSSKSKSLQLETWPPIVTRSIERRSSHGKSSDEPARACCWPERSILMLLFSIRGTGSSGRNVWDEFNC